jgi:hypothetical protein
VQAPRIPGKGIKMLLTAFYNFVRQSILAALEFELAFALFPPGKRRFKKEDIPR